MNHDNEKPIAAKLAKIMAMLCVRNTLLETLHAGLTPITRSGDYSDVFVLDADGRRIPWTEVSCIDEDEMRALMRDIVNRPYTFHLTADDPKLQATIERWMGVADKCRSAWQDGRAWMVNGSASVGTCRRSFSLVPTS